MLYSQMFAQHILRNWTRMCPACPGSDGRDRKGIKSHPDRLLSFLPPAPSGISSLLGVCVRVRVRLCYVYQTVCVSACVHGFPCGCESTCVHVCVVCFNAPATCGNLTLDLEQAPVLGSVQRCAIFLCLFPPSASDSSNKLSRLGYSPQYKAVFPFVCSFSLVLSSLSFHKNNLFSPADTFL